MPLQLAARVPRRLRRRAMDGHTTTIAPLNDAQIRSALRSWLAGRLARDPDTVILDELGLCRGQVRVDLTVVNGSIHGFEIKSDRDSLFRLTRQAEIYSRVLDRATLVVGERHLAAAMSVIPLWWGIVRVESAASGPRFRSFRRGSKNPRRDARSLVELLWLEDALALLEQRDLAVGIRAKPRRVLWDRLCEHLEIDEIGAAVRAQLKARPTTSAVPRLG